MVVSTFFSIIPIYHPEHESSGRGLPSLRHPKKVLGRRGRDISAAQQRNRDFLRVFKNQGSLSGGPHKKDYGIFGSFWGTLFMKVSFGVVAFRI